MPELPEVETVARSLVDGQDTGTSLIGKRVSHARVGWQRTIAHPSVSAFRSRLKGQRVKAVGRRGKFIRIDLTSYTMLVHLRMSGDLILGYADKPIGRHSRAELYFQDGLQLSFDDARKFGRIWLVEDAERVLADLGPEPFDSKLTPSRFHAMLAVRNRQLKPLLLDQTFIAGLGNIYADEALWASRLHPLTTSNSVSKAQAGDLLRAIRKVLREGIRRNGASIDWVYRGGEFQNHFKAYQQTGEPCSRCGSPIRRIVVGQRSTHFCAVCQKRKS
jgi:formamidopyrimidine-DNA glycosylase